MGDTLEIDFTLGTPVPLSPWFTAILVVALGLAALALLKRRGTPRMLLLGAAAIVASGVFVLPRTTEAVLVFGLLASPQFFPVTCLSNANPRFENATGQTITLTKVAINSGGLGVTLDGGSCQVGTRLAPNAQCTLVYLLPQTCQQGT